MFSLGKLKLYDKALASAASLAQHSQSWDKRHAVTDQLLRASAFAHVALGPGLRMGGLFSKPAGFPMAAIVTAPIHRSGCSNRREVAYT